MKKDKIREAFENTALAKPFLHYVEYDNQNNYYQIRNGLSDDDYHNYIVSKLNDMLDGYESAMQSAQEEISELSSELAEYKLLLKEERAIRKALEEEIERLKKKNEDLKCCGNCGNKNYTGYNSRCSIDLSNTKDGSGVCTRWQAKR